MAVSAALRGLSRPWVRGPRTLAVSWSWYLLFSGTFLGFFPLASRLDAGLRWLGFILGCPPSVALLWRMLTWFFVRYLLACPHAAAVPLDYWVRWCSYSSCWVTYLMSGRCSSSVHNRDVAFPPLVGFAFHLRAVLLPQGITAVCFLYRRSLGCDVQSSTFQCSIVRFRPLFFTWRLPPSVPKVLCQDNWMVSIDLKDAYLQIPIHPQSRKYFQFILNGKMHQFRVFCFSLTAAPQVYAQVMAPVLVFLHQIGCLDDWQILAPGYSVILLARDMTLVFCQELGICVNLEKFCLVPSLTNDLFGDDPFKHDFKGFSDVCAGSESSSSIRGIIAPLCGGVFWVISFLCLGWFQGCLWMRSLQLCLNHQWDFWDSFVLVYADE